MIARNAPANLFDGDGSFDREMRKYFREAERRAHYQRLAIVVGLLVVSLACNASQLWMYVESLKICGVRP